MRSGIGKRMTGFELGLGREGSVSLWILRRFGREAEQRGLEVVGRAGLVEKVKGRWPVS